VAHYITIRFRLILYQRAILYTDQDSAVCATAF